MNLYTFSFAGGSSYSLDLYKKYFLEQHTLISQEYPGRGRKMGLSLIDEASQLVEHFYSDFKHRSDYFCFYGHSMGTLVSYLLTRKLHKNGNALPLHLFVSGRGGPANALDETRYNLPKVEFWQRIKELGGSPEEVLADQDLMDFFEPILRADFKTIETYQYQEAEPLDIPITVFLGKDDKVTEEEALLWQKETTHPIDIHYFSGGHFFVFDHAKEIAGIMQKKIKEHL